jgi:hypothetical protein
VKGIVPLARTNVGEFEVTFLSDGFIDFMFTGATAEEVEELSAARSRRQIGQYGRAGPTQETQGVAFMSHIVAAAESRPPLPPFTLEGGSGNENWEFDEAGLMRLRITSINDLPIKECKRKYHWRLTAGRTTTRG